MGTSEAWKLISFTLSRYLQKPTNTRHNKAGDPVINTEHLLFQAPFYGPLGTPVAKRLKQYTEALWVLNLLRKKGYRI